MLAQTFNGKNSKSNKDKLCSWRAKYKNKWQSEKRKYHENLIESDSISNAYVEQEYSEREIFY